MLMLRIRKCEYGLNKNWTSFLFFKREKKQKKLAKGEFVKSARRELIFLLLEFCSLLSLLVPPVGEMTIDVFNNEHVFILFILVLLSFPFNFFNLFHYFIYFDVSAERK